MSNRTYNALWIKTQHDLHNLLYEESQASSAKPEKDREVSFKGVSKLYLQYILVFRNLESCYDQIVHPQKRILLRQLLQSVIGRILELKHELVNLDFLEYSFHDENISELGLSPAETELVVPRFVVQERAQEIKYWQGRMEEAMEKMEQSDMESQGTSLSFEEALLLLQKHERARQGRLRAKLMLEIRKQEASEKAKNSAETSISAVLAASKIQSIWKGALARRRVRKQREEELAFIGMIPPTEYPHVYQDRLAEIEARRREIQEEHQRDYEKALVSVKEDLRETDGDEIEEEMKEQIREWFFHGRDDQGKFPDYPSDDEGGSAAIFHPERFQYGFSAADPGGDSGLGQGQGTSRDREEGDGKPKAGGGSGGSKEAAEEEEVGFVLRSTDFVKQIKSGHKTFNDIWKNKNESMNKTQSCDLEMIRDEKRGEVEEEIRLQVDALMREELDLLKIAAERDKGKRGKISKKRKKGKKKASKKGKKKKDKDLTPDRSTESLYEELVLNGIIKPYPKVPLADFLGDINYVGSILKKKAADQSKDPVPGAGDIRRAIIEYCILPMCSPSLREQSPHVKSLLLAGASGTGKTMLLNAICTELGATFFNLTATNIVGKYPGKSGLNMLLHLVIKVSRLLQPSIIFIDQAEKTFLKKVSKTDKSDPKRLKKDLPRLVRSLAAEDCVMLIGSSRCPWECEQKGLTQTYQKTLVLPKPGYGFRHNLWKHLITSRGGRIMRWSDKFDLSALAKVSDGYTAGHITQSVALTLTERRIMQQGQRPLQPVEFVGSLAKHEPIYREEEEAFTAWYSKTHMGKKRGKHLEGEDEDAKKEKKKPSKKKK